MLQKVDRNLISQQVYRSLKNSILEGAFPIGSRLVEAEIAKQMGTSRGPVREALRQLEVEGLVEVRPNIGTFIRSLTLKEIKETYTIRSILEAYAAKLASSRATKSDIEEMRKIAQSAFEAALYGDIRETVKYDFCLHKTIWKASYHNILNDILLGLEARVRIFLLLQAPLFPKLIESIKDHSAIIDAIEKKQGNIASKLIKEHILQAGIMIIHSKSREI